MLGPVRIAPSWECLMAFLRCYFLDENGRIIGIKGFDGGTVSAAVAQGTKLAGQRHRCDSIEIWRGGERLYPDASAVVVPIRAYSRSK